MINLCHHLLIALSLVALGQAPAAQPAVQAEYIRALGGAAALRAVTSRITEGQFDNGRGLKEPFKVYEKAPNKRLTVIGRRSMSDPDSSGRGYDGTTGWDRNFIGTGLRTVEGRELADLAREADLLKPLHLFDACSSVIPEAPAEQLNRVVCRLPDGRTERVYFAATGLLVRKDVELPDRRGVTSARFDQYRPVDAVLVPFRTTVVLPDGGVVTYVTERVRHNEPIDDTVFARPATASLIRRPQHAAAFRIY